MPIKCANCDNLNSITSENCSSCGLLLHANSPRDLPSKPVTVISAPTNNRSYSPYALFALAIVYALLPVDIIPDAPAIGWIDDFFVMLVAGFNLMEKGMGVTNKVVISMLNLMKWGVIILGVIAVSLLGLLGAAIYKLIWG